MRLSPNLQAESVREAPELEVSAAASVPERELGAKGAFGILVYFLLAQFAIVFVGAIFLAPVAKGSAWQPVLMLLGSVYGAWIAVRESRRSFGTRETLARALGLRRASLSALTVAVLVGAALSLLNLQFLIRALPPSESQLGPFAAALRDPGIWRVLYVAGVLLIAPTTEEFLFRGVLFGGATRSWGQPIAALVTTLVFTALHFRGLPVYWPTLAAVCQLALAAQLTRIWTGSILPAMAMHFAWNLASVVPGLF